MISTDIMQAILFVWGGVSVGLGCATLEFVFGKIWAWVFFIISYTILIAAAIMLGM
jgi:hypothetical protein